MADILHDIIEIDLTANPAVDDLLNIDGAFQPKLYTITLMKTATAGSSTAHIIHSVGACDLTRERTVSVRTKDNATAAGSARRDGATNAVIGVLNVSSSAMDVEWTHNATRASGIQLKCTNAATIGACKMIVEFWGGADYQGYVNHAVLNSTATKITSGFEPDLVEAFGHCDDITTAGGFANFWRGVGVNAATAENYGHAWTTATDSGDAVAILYNNKVGAQLSSSGSVSHNYEIDNYVSDGCDITASTSTGSDEAIVICHKFTNAGVKAGIGTLPTSTSTDWEITVGHTPLMFNMISTNITTENSLNTSDMQFGYSVNNGTDSASLSGSVEDGLTTSNVNSRYDSKSLTLIDVVGSGIDYDADNMTMESNSVKITAANITTASATAHKFLWWSVEDTDGGISGTINQTAPSFTQSSAGTFYSSSSGTIDQTAPSFTQSASGEFEDAGFSGTISQTAPSFTQSAEGSFQSASFSGTIEQAAPSFTQSATAGFFASYNGDISQTAPSFTQSTSANYTPLPITGTITQTAPSFTQYAYYQPFVSPESTEALESKIYCCKGVNGFIDTSDIVVNSDVDDNANIEAKIKTVESAQSIIDSDNLSLNSNVTESIAVTGVIDR